MVDQVLDFAVLGSTPLALLLAGLLAGTHGRKVALIGRQPSPFQPPRGFDLSVAPITRPATWALLKRTTGEVARLLNGVDRRLLRRISPHVVARGPAAMDPLAHMRHIAAAYGYPVERLASRQGATYRYREALLLDRTLVPQVLVPWTELQGVQRIDPDEADVEIGHSGSGRIVSAGSVLPSRQVVLADDAAILSHLGAGLPERVAASPILTILTEPSAAAREAFELDADTGVILGHRYGGGMIATAPGTRAVARARIASALQQPARVAGEAAFMSISMLDGAPAFGEVGDAGVTAIAGLGLIAAFLAPAIARQLAGQASEEEAAFFAARSWDTARTGVAEWTTPAPADAAA